MVLQEPYLFHGTILETIRYGLPEAKLEEVVDAAKAANAHDFVCELATGTTPSLASVDKPSPEVNVNAYRLSIARAILHDPRILILD